MEPTHQQWPSAFAQMVDKLQNKSEEEIKMLYIKFFENELKEEWQTITKKSDFKNATDEDIIKAIQQNPKLQSE